MTYMVRLQNVSKAYKGKEVIKNVSMEIESGKIYGFLGPNGAGKTTIMKMILNLVKPNTGTIEVFGEQVGRDSYQYLKNIGSIIEYPIFYSHLSAYENLKLHCDYLGYYDYDKIQQLLELVKLSGVENQLISEFSLGMKQRLGIARAMLTNPKLLILDEPINGLDPIGIKQMRELLLRLKKEYQTTILISSHIITEIEQIADEVGVINQGILVKEVTLSEVKKEAVQFITIKVDDLEKAISVMDLNFADTNVKVVAEDTMRIYSDKLTQEQISRQLILAGVNIYSMATASNTLEDYFLNIVNGETRAC